MTEVDTTSTNGAIVETPNLTKIARFADYMAGRAKLNEGEDAKDSAKEIQASIAIRVLEAKTVEEVWDADEGGLPGGRDLVDVEQRIFGIDYVSSRSTGDEDDEYESLFGQTYLVVHAMRLSDGTPLDWNTSATALVAKLVKFEQMDMFGDNRYVDAVIRAVGTGKRKPLKLRPLTARAV